jgi:hypothetical protein
MTQQIDYFFDSLSPFTYLFGQRARRHQEKRWPSSRKDAAARKACKHVPKPATQPAQDTHS